MTEFQWPDGRKLGTVDFTPDGPVRQTQPEPKREVTFTATVAVDVETWAAEYGIAEEEVLEDVKTYLNTALSDLNEMLHLRGAIK